MDLATIQIKVDTRQVKAANEDIKQLGTTGQMTSKKVNAANDDMAKSAKSTTSAFKLLGGAMAALGVGALVSNFARTVTESERLKGSLKTMTGSTEDAAFAFSELEKFASQTPFTLDQSVEGFIKLKALGLDPSERALRSYGNTSAAMGKDMMQMIEAVADASTGEFERLKEFGIKASKQGDDVSLTFQGVTKTIGNSSAEIQNYLLEIGETKFGTAMEDQMKALPGLLSNLQDNVSALFRKIGDVGGINLFAGAITTASSVVLLITENIELLGTGLVAAAAGFAAFTIGSNAANILAGLKNAKTGITAVRTAVLAMNTAILANPIGLIAAAIATSTVLIISYWDEIKSAAETAGVMAQIAFEKLKLFLMENFSTVFSAITSSFNLISSVASTVGGAISSALKSAFELAKNAIVATVTSIELKWTTLKLFFETTFSNAISGLSNMFTSLQNTAIATMAAVAAAAKDPFNAISTFNDTFDKTLTKLESGATNSNTFATSIIETKSRISDLETELETMNTEVDTSNTNFGNAGKSLSDYAVEVDASAVAANDLAVETEAANTKALELLGTISNEKEALHLTNLEIDIRNGLQKTGVDATSDLGKAIIDATTELHNEKDAILDAAEAAKQLEKDNNAAQKAIETEAKRVAEEAAKAYEKMKNNISGFFMDLFENGRDAFDNIAKTFKNMILKMLADWAASKIADIMTGTFSGIGTSISGMFSGIFSSIGSSIAGLASSAASVVGSLVTGGGGAAATRAAITAGTSSMAANAAIGAAATGTAAAAGSATAAQAAIAAGTSTMAASAAAAAGSTAAAGGGAAAGSAAAGSSGFANALATAGPYAVAIVAAYLAAKALDSGGTPTSTAGLTMAKTGGMSDANIFAMDSFESGFSPLGFKQNATNAQAEAAVAPLRELDAALTAITKESGYAVNLSGHTFNGLGVEGSGPGTVLGMFVEEGKAKGESIESQMDRYATEWIQAVGARNNVDSSAINDVIGDGSAAGIISRANAVLTAATLARDDLTLQQKVEKTGMDLTDLLAMNTGGDTSSEISNSVVEANSNTITSAAVDAIDTLTTGINTLTVSRSNDAITLTGGSNTINAQSAANMGPQQYPQMGPIPGHRDGLNMVPYDGYVAELHAGERVQTAEQARASDNVADEMSGLRQSIEDVMIAVARNTQKLYRLNDRWDKNGLPPVRA